MTSLQSMKCWLLLLMLVPAFAYAQKKQVSIRIGQEETRLLDQYENQITLQRKSFKIQVMLENVAGVYVFAAFSDSICCRLSELDTIPGFIDFPSRTMSESEYNKDKELLVNDDHSCAYWYYNKEASWHGFNKKVILLDDGRVVAVKTVKQLYHVSQQRLMKMKDVHAPLYLFFVAVSDFDAAGKPVKELMRRKVRIDWVNEE